MSDSLRAELQALPPALSSRLATFGFDHETLVQHAGTLDPKRTADARRLRNQVAGEVVAPKADQIPSLPAAGSAEALALADIGRAALERGELAFCVMAGGMATRMGSVVKALVEALPGKTFLDLRLTGQRTASARAGRPIPLWLMTSDATDTAIREALKNQPQPNDAIEVFAQCASLRLTPEGALFRHENAAPSAYATGHGDLVDSLKGSGLLARFHAAGGKYIWVTNLDNLGATIDETLLGFFIQSGLQAMAEVCPKVAGDRGGIPVHCAGKLQILEEFRLPEHFDPSTVPVFNTNTFLLSVDALLQYQFPWTYFEVEKQVEGKPAIQFERLLQEVTAYLRAGYVQIPRDGAASRFIPVKDMAELQRRAETLYEVARTRGMLAP